MLERLWENVQDCVWCGTLMFFLVLDLAIDGIRRKFSKEC